MNWGSELQGGYNPFRRAERRWAGLIAGAALSAAIPAFLVSDAVPKQYEATAQLYLAPASTPAVAFQDPLVAEAQATSYAELARSEIVLQAAKETVGWSGDLKSFQGNSTIAQTHGTAMISISFRSGDPAFAAKAAQTIVDVFIRESRDFQVVIVGPIKTDLDDHVGEIEADIRLVDGRITSLDAQLEAAKTSGAPVEQRVDLENQLRVLESSRRFTQQKLAGLVRTRDDMRDAQARADTTTVIRRSATRPDQPASPRPLVNAVIGAIVGGLLAQMGFNLIKSRDDSHGERSW